MQTGFFTISLDY